MQGPQNIDQSDGNEGRHYYKTDRRDKEEYLHLH